MFLDDCLASGIVKPDAARGSLVFDMTDPYRQLPEDAWAPAVTPLIETTPARPPHMSVWVEARLEREAIHAAGRAQGMTEEQIARHHHVFGVGVLYGRTEDMYRAMERLNPEPVAGIRQRFAEILPTQPAWALNMTFLLGFSWRKPLVIGMGFVGLDDAGLVMRPPGFGGDRDVPRFACAQIAAGDIGDDANIGEAIRDRTWQVLYTLSLLNVKNIVTDAHAPNEKLQRARVRRGKPELVTYHTLRVLEPGVTVRRDGETKERQGIRPIHLVRGNFAHYTAESPLFGRFTGTYWRPSHVRGDRKNGVALKDYDVATAIGGGHRHEETGDD